MADLSIQAGMMGVMSSAASAARTISYHAEQKKNREQAESHFQARKELKEKEIANEADRIKIAQQKLPGQITAQEIANEQAAADVEATKAGTKKTKAETSKLNAEAAGQRILNKQAKNGGGKTAESESAYNKSAEAVNAVETNFKRQQVGLELIRNAANAREMGVPVL